MCWFICNGLSWWSKILTQNLKKVQEMLGSYKSRICGHGLTKQKKSRSKTALNYQKTIPRKLKTKTTTRQTKN